MTCRPNGRNQPRLLTGHHKPDCDDDTCAGCQPCPEDHCPRCWLTHSAGVCPACLASGREDLSEIVALHANLLAEALLGTAATSGAIPGGQATVALGPCSPGTASLWDTHYADDTRIGDWHPLLTLATWATCWRGWFGTPEPTTRATVASEAGYLDRTLHLAAATQPRGDEWPPELPDMLRDLATLRYRLEDVTHDGDRHDRSGVPCLDCGKILERRWADEVADDRWVCPRCRRRYTAEEFNLARAEHLGTAAHFVDVATAAAAIGRSGKTIRDWVRRELVAAERNAAGLLVVWWPDVYDQHRKREIRDTLRQFHVAS